MFPGSVDRDHSQAFPDRAAPWWVVRGQLVDSPGYRVNYTAGAILITDLRARLRERHGSYALGDPAWYRRVARSLYRFGLEKPSKDVIEQFLGRPLSPPVLLDDMARATAGVGDRIRARVFANHCRAGLARKGRDMRSCLGQGRRYWMPRLWGHLGVSL